MEVVYINKYHKSTEYLLSDIQKETIKTNFIPPFYTIWLLRGESVRFQTGREKGLQTFFHRTIIKSKLIGGRNDDAAAKCDLYHG